MTTSPTEAGLHRKALADEWHLVASLLAGVSAMRVEAYLPRYEAETEHAYNSRVARSFLYPGFRRGIGLLTSRIFSKPITRSQDMPERIADLLDDVDLRGNGLDRFARAFFSNGAAFGQSHILVDYTQIPKEATAADELRIRPRPFLRHVRAQDLLDADYVTEGGRTVCSYARILEYVEIRTGYTKERVKQVRILEPGQWKTLREGKKGWEVHEEGTMTVGGKALPYVPLVSYFPGEEGVDLEAQPPMIDLAYKNLEHFQSSSDQRNILTFARFPMLAVAGEVAVDVDEDGNPKPLTIGPRKILSTSDPQGKWYYVEPQGAAIEAGRKDLEDLKTEMEMLSFAPLMPKTGDIKATAHAVTHSEANTAAQSMALSMKDALDQSIHLMGVWERIEEPGTAQLNSDFGLSVAEQERIRALLDMRGRRDLSRETMWNEMKVNGVLSQDFDGAAEADRLADEGESLPGFRFPADSKDDDEGDEE